MAQILDGLKISNEIKQEIKAEVDKIKASKKEFRIFLQFWLETMAQAKLM